MQPPALEPNDERNPALQRPYKNVDKSCLPLTESLKDTVARVVPYFEENIHPLLDDDKKVIVAAHGNSLRALVMYLEKMSEEEIIALNLPTGVPLVYHLDDKLNILKKEFLADPEALKAKMDKVANQGEAKK